MVALQLNVFLNSYQQPENKLTYNFLCLIEHIRAKKELLEFLCEGRLTLDTSPIESLRTLYSGGSSNPDGALTLRTQNGRKCTVFIENKTVRAELSPKQLHGHLREYCNEHGHYLLVITPRPTDAVVARSVGMDKIFFRTWGEIAGKLREIDTARHDFIVAQFLEYGRLSGEFRNMLISNDEVRTYIAYVKSDPVPKLRHLFETTASTLDWTRFHPFNKVTAKWEDNWGRMGLEFEYPHPKKMMTWFSFGIYYNEEDHGIPFKNDEPELAFFFDIEPEDRVTLERTAGLVAAMAELEKQGFEQNLTKHLTTNPWRLFCKRTPLSQTLPLTSESLSRRLYDIVAAIIAQRDLVAACVEDA
jgi:hypothetical protein